MTEVFDLGDEIYGFGEELRGGEINFLGRLQGISENDGLRWGVFHIDDNNAAGDCTALAFATHQKRRDLQPFEAAQQTGNFFLMSIDVERIATKKGDLLMDDDTGETVWLRPVLGRLHLRTKPGDDMDLNRAKFVQSVNGIATLTYDRNRKPTHVQFVCVDPDTADSTKVSREEKNRRINGLMAKLDPTGKAKRKDDALWDDVPLAGAARGSGVDARLDGGQRFVATLALVMRRRRQ